MWQGSSLQCKALSVLTLGKPSCACSLWVESRHLQPFICPRDLPAAKGGCPPLCRTLGLWFPDCGLSCLLPRVGECLCGPFLPLRSLSRVGVSALCLFLSYPVTWRSFLQLWWYRSSFASFHLVFCENCSTCIVFLLCFCRGRGELHILLVHHLDNNPALYIVFCLFPFNLFVSSCFSWVF